MESENVVVKKGEGTAAAGQAKGTCAPLAALALACTTNRRSVQSRAAPQRTKSGPAGALHAVPEAMHASKLPAAAGPAFRPEREKEERGFERSGGAGRARCPGLALAFRGDPGG